MGTQEPLQRVSRGLVHSFEKWIFLPSLVGGVGSSCVHYIWVCTCVAHYTGLFRERKTLKMPLKPASLCTALSQTPKGRSHRLTLPFPFSHMTRSGCWLLPLSWGLHRRWGGATGLFRSFLSFPCHCQPVLSVPQWGWGRGDGQDAPPRRTWISRNNRLLMVGSCDQLKDLALSLALQDAEGRRVESSDELIVWDEPTTGWLTLRAHCCSLCSAAVESGGAWR